MKMKHVTYCEDCKCEFSVSSVDIQETVVDLDEQVITLVYFACPKCNKVYRIILKDERFDELKKDLEETKKRVRRNQGSLDEEFARQLNDMVFKKLERLRNHVENLNAKFPGTFVFVASENNHEEKIIKYLP